MRIPTQAEIAKSQKRLAEIADDKKRLEQQQSDALTAFRAAAVELAEKYLTLEKNYGYIANLARELLELEKRI